MVNSMLVAWIFNTIEPSLRSTITYMENVKDLWEELHQRFSIGNGPRIHQLKADLAACKQRGDTVIVYYGRLKMMWDELVNYEPIPKCQCEGYKCKITSALERKRDEERLHQFMMGLDDVVYGTVRSNILNMDPLSNINRPYSMIVQEERHRTMARGSDERSEAVGFSTQLGTQARVATDRGKEKQGTCGHCGKPGHEAKACYQIIGYPEWWGERPRGTDKGGSRGRGSFGRGKPSGGRLNAARVAADDVTNSERSGIPNLSEDQWATLLDMLNQNKGGDDRLSGKDIHVKWIVDSGASHHMTGSLNLLSDVCDLAPIPVELPDGAKVTALKAGKLQLGNGIYLNNILFVPNLHCTLIYVSKLAKELNCLVTFVDELCVIHDRNSRILIGTGEQRDGAYFFRAVPRARTSKVTGVDEQELWHRRIGHPSRKLLSFLPVVKSRVGYRDSGDFCDICLRAKQTRESFPLIINKTDDCFSLIQVYHVRDFSVETRCKSNHVVSSSSSTLDLIIAISISLK